MRVRFSKRAQRDRREISAYYGADSPTAAARFKVQLGEALEFIAKYPEGAQRISSRLRAKVVLHFPYSVIYEIADGEIRVASIACHYRKPQQYEP